MKHTGNTREEIDEFLKIARRWKICFIQMDMREKNREEYLQVCTDRGLYPEEEVLKFFEEDLNIWDEERLQNQREMLKFLD